MYFHEYSTSTETNVPVCEYECMSTADLVRSDYKIILMRTSTECRTTLAYLLCSMQYLLLFFNIFTDTGERNKKICNIYHVVYIFIVTLLLLLFYFFL